MQGKTEQSKLEEAKQFNDSKAASMKKMQEIQQALIASSTNDPEYMEMDDEFGDYMEQ